MIPGNNLRDNSFMNPNLESLTPEQMAKAIKLLKQQAELIKYNKLDTFEPYGWQESFINASATNKQLLAMTGNRCGKTFTGAFIMACHLTGLYPEWWEGYRFNRPVAAWAAGISTVTTRDILQAELLGDPVDPQQLGSGAIPRDFIVRTVNKVGIPNAVESVVVKHVSGGSSTLTFKSYEMSQDKFMGTAIDVIWLDKDSLSYAPLVKVYKADRVNSGKPLVGNPERSYQRV